MSTRLANHLTAAREGSFVGRASEQLVFQAALIEQEPPFHVLHVFGPGGIGKTTLLRKFMSLCHQAEVQATYIDSRNLEQAPNEFLTALKSAVGLDPEGDLFEALTAGAGRHVILIDTYEGLASLDNWLREVFLPHLPENVLVVLAGRNPPTPAWRTDPGWQALIHILPLRNLSPEESRSYLVRRGVPQEEHQNVLAFTHGHPLALSLVTDLFDQRPGLHFQPEAAPDVLRMLLEQLLQQVPGPAHRAALEACALVRVTTEALLAEMLAMPDPTTEAGQVIHELFEWLRGLSSIEFRPGGLAPHDVVREVLAAELRWRNPDWYAELHHRARTYYARRLYQVQGHERQRVLLDYIFLHRDNPVVKPFFEWQTSGGIMADTLREADPPELLAMVTRHEGEESARLAAHWLEQQPQGVLVFREAEQQPVGFMAMVALQQASDQDLQADPAAEVAWRYLQTYAPLRAGEKATLFRFWMARDTYQAVSPIQSLIFVHAVGHYLTTPGLAFTFFPCAEPDFWAPVFAYADLARLPEADSEVAGRRYGVYGHDWRAMPPMRWLALLAEREVATAPQTIPPSQVSEPLVVLSQSEFAAAVRDALRDFSRPEVLLANPLLRSRLVIEQSHDSAGEAERVAGLYTPDYEGMDVAQATPQRGLDGIRQMVARYTGAFPDLRFTADETVIEGNRVVVVWTAHGTHQGPLMNIPASGRRIRVRGVSVLTLEDSRVRRAIYVWDVAGLLRSIGLLPEL